MITFVPICFSTNNVDDLFKEIFKDINNVLKRTNQSTYITVEIGTEPESMNISRINEISTSSSKFISKSDQITPIRHLDKKNLLDF